MFGKGDAAYPGVMALEDIGPEEVFIEIPSHMVINTKVAL